MSQLFASGVQSIEASASASVLPMNEYSGLISFVYFATFMLISNYLSTHLFSSAFVLSTQAP